VAAGADGIMIHSRSRDPGETFTFCDRFRNVDAETMLVAIPTSYNGVYEHELEARASMSSSTPTISCVRPIRP
jgi:phosphoenolpyruvate phosphomutase